MAVGGDPSYAETQPAILINSWGNTADLEYMKRLGRRGLEMEIISHRDLSWDVLKNYNVLVLHDFPQLGQVRRNPIGAPGRGLNLEETLDLVDRFLSMGGGVMVNLVQHHNDPEFHNSAQVALARWGARRPFEKIVMPADQVRQHARLRLPFFYTTNVQPSEVSENVSGVWHPVGGGYWNVAGPIDVDDSWNVVLKAPAGSRTEPLEMPEVRPGVPHHESVFIRDPGVEQPALFAIRDLAPGRLALFHAHPNFHMLSGLSWVHDGVMLERGLENRRSDYGVLLENTLRWLAEPSLATDQLGGATTPPNRWLPPLEHPDNPNYRRLLGASPDINLDPDLPPPAVLVFKGIIGPRTTYSGGAGTVSEYAAVAREKGLSFIIFLEDMARLNPEKLAQLTADCHAHSDADLLLLSGYRADTNLGNQLFIFGKDPLFMHDRYLTPDRETVIIQPQDEEGRYIRSRFIDFVMESRSHGDLGPNVRHHKFNNSVGFFDFTGPMKEGGMAIHDLRLFSMAGVVYYRDGKRVEQVTDQHLLTNAGTMPAIPVAINLVDSPQAMKEEINAGHALTYAVAASVETLWNEALNWNHQISRPNVFPSTGPLVRHWPGGFYRTEAYAGELFVSERMLVAPHLQVTSDVGLREVSLFDGDRLFRRIWPQGSKDFTHRLFLSGSLQRNLSVVATDIDGGTAVSFPLRGWSERSPAPVFCGDHVNDCGAMKMFRGPAWSRFTNIPLVPNPGELWDGMAQIVRLPLFGWGHVHPVFNFDDGSQVGRNITQTPVLELCDDTVYRGRTVSRGQIAPGQPGMSPWTGFGPIDPLPFIDITGIYTEWAQYQTGTPTGWGPMGEMGGPAASMYTQKTTFTEDNLTLVGAMLGYEWRQDIPANVMLVLGRGDRILKARDVAPRGDRVAPGDFAWRIETGDWLAAISPNQANAMWLVNRGVPLRIRVRPDRSALYEDLPASGLPVQSGESRIVEWFTCWWPLDTPIPDTDALLRHVRYFTQPDGLEILRGERLDAPPGVIELAADNHVAEIALPKPEEGLDPNLPFRVDGMNPRWSAVLWQKTGYVGAGRYGPPENRFRNLGVDFDGRIYFPVYAGQARRHHLVAGHPVVADAAGRDLFINVVCLKDAEGVTPPLWHVAVNNPTDQSVTAVLRKAMDLPGLEWAGEEVALQPGEYRILVHPVD